MRYPKKFMVHRVFSFFDGYLASVEILQERIVYVFYKTIIWTYFHKRKNRTRESCAKAARKHPREGAKILTAQAPLKLSGSGRDSRNGFQHRSFGGHPFAPDKRKSTSYQLGCLSPLYVSHSIPLHPHFCGLNPSFSPVTWDISPVGFPLYPHHSPYNLITSFVSLSLIFIKVYHHFACLNPHCRFIPHIKVLQLIWGLWKWILGSFRIFYMWWNWIVL